MEVMASCLRTNRTYAIFEIMSRNLRRGSSPEEVNDMSHFLEHVLRVLLVVMTLCAAPVAASTPAEIPLWSNGAPGSEGKPAKEDITTSASGELRVAGIHNPTMTPYLPAEATATGLAILVIPGGGHGPGGVYGERKRNDFFVHHLRGVEPPDCNRVESKAHAAGAT
jgi:hypothetical protein